MPAYFIIDEEHRMVFSYAAGVLAYEDCVGHMDRLSSDPRFHPDFNQIFDFAGVTKFALTAPQLYQLSMRKIFSRRSRRAMILVSDLHYGMGRIFSALRHTEGESGLIPFRELGPAIVWTNTVVEVAHKAFAELRKQSQNPDLPPPQEARL